MIFFETQTGSSYEVDEEQRRIRRVSGTKPPRQRQGEDGTWRPYADLSPIELGDRVLIRWPDSVPLLDGSPPEAKPATVTSPVVRCGVRS